MTTVSRRKAITFSGAALLTATLAGCAAPPPALPTDMPNATWRGRLSLVLEKSDQPQSFITAFRLQGNAKQGVLDLYSPLGSTLAQVRWDPKVAVVQQGNMAREYPDLDNLLMDVSGANIPVAALFDWLRGIATPVPGWTPDLSQLSQGLLSAHRDQPLPTARLRLVLETD